MENIAHSSKTKYQTSAKFCMQGLRSDVKPLQKNNFGLWGLIWPPLSFWKFQFSIARKIFSVLEKATFFTFLAKMNLKMLERFFLLEISVPTRFSDELGKGDFEAMSHFKTFLFLARMNLKMLLKIFDWKLVFPQGFLMTWPTWSFPAWLLL